MDVSPNPKQQAPKVRVQAEDSPVQLPPRMQRTLRALCLTAIKISSDKVSSRLWSGDSSPLEHTCDECSRAWTGSVTDVTHHAPSCSVGNMARLVNELVDEFEGFGLEDSAAPSPSERSSTDSGPAGGAGVLQPRRNRLALPWKVIAPGALDEDNEIVADGARCIMDSLGRVVATFHPTDLPFELERMAAHRIVECVNGGAQ